MCFLMESEKPGPCHRRVDVFDMCICCLSHTLATIIQVMLLNQLTLCYVSMHSPLTIADNYSKLNSVPVKNQYNERFTPLAIRSSVNTIVDSQCGQILSTTNCPQNMNIFM